MNNTTKTNTDSKVKNVSNNKQQQLPTGNFSMLPTGNKNIPTSWQHDTSQVGSKLPTGNFSMLPVGNFQPYYTAQNSITEGEMHPDTITTTTSLDRKEVLGNSNLLPLPSLEDQNRPSRWTSIIVDFIKLHLTSMNECISIEDYFNKIKLLYSVRALLLDKKYSSVILEYFHLHGAGTTDKIIENRSFSTKKQRKIYQVCLDRKLKDFRSYNLLMMEKLGKYNVWIAPFSTLEEVNYIRLYLTESPPTPILDLAKKQQFLTENQKKFTQIISTWGNKDWCPLCAHFKMPSKLSIYGDLNTCPKVTSWWHVDYNEFKGWSDL